MSLFNSNTEMPVPSNVTLCGSFCDLNLKKTEEDMMSSTDINRCTTGSNCAGIQRDRVLSIIEDGLLCVEC